MKEKKVLISESKVDVTNDSEMVSLGIRVPVYEGRDESVWTKTDKEKALLSKMKSSCTTKFDSGWGPNPKSVSIPGTLIVYIKPSSKFVTTNKKGEKIKKTTFSHKCILSDIPRILGKYVEQSKDNKLYSIVTKYVWNGKTYSSKELPFWY